MLQLSQISLDVALLIGRGLLLTLGFVVAAIAFTRWRRASEHAEELFALQNNALISRLNALESQLAAIHAQQASANEQIATVAALAGQWQESEQRRTSGPAPAAAPSYQIAIRLARSGATREELMASCGLSRQEAELVRRLHSPARTARLAVAS